MEKVFPLSNSVLLLQFVKVRRILYLSDFRPSHTPTLQGKVVLRFIIHLVKFIVDLLRFLFGGTLVLIFICTSKISFKIVPVKVDLTRWCLWKISKRSP